MLLTFLAILILILAVCGAPAADAPADTAASSDAPAATGGLEGAELIVAIENAYPPFSFIDEDSGEAIGYDYDIFNKI